MFPKKGNKFPARDARKYGSYASLVGDALQASLGDTHRVIKTLMRWTGANERTVKNWLSGRVGPSGDHLIVLLRESDAVLKAILSAAERRDMLDALTIREAHGRLSEMLAALSGQQIDPADHTTGDMPLPMDAGDAQLQRGPINDPVNDPISGPVNRALRADHNDRQRWFLQELAQGRTIGAVALRLRWGISERTAKRDIAVLKARGLVEFVGAFKTGAYRLMTSSTL